MNKTITIYELLGLIKDGKAPNKIKYNSFIFELGKTGIYSTESNRFLTDYHLIEEMLNDTVEIIDETYDEFEDIEEKDVYIDLSYSIWSDEQCDELIDNLNRHEKAIKQLIRNQKKIIEELKKKAEI